MPRKVRTLQELAESRSLTLYGLARDSGLSLRNIRYMAAGRTQRPHAGTLALLAQTLGVARSTVEAAIQESRRRVEADED